MEGRGAVDYKMEEQVRSIAAKLRKIREMKGLTREKFCEPLHENCEYWGAIERGEQAISLTKLLLVCEVYSIPVEEVVCLNYQSLEDQQIRDDIAGLLQQCDGRQLEVIRQFILSIAMAL